MNSKDLKQLFSKQTLIVTLVITSLSSLVTWSLTKSYVENSHKFVAIRENDALRPLIKPLLAYKTPEMQSSNPLESALTKEIKVYTDENKVKTISVYYRDLSTGRWFGINQDEKFVPASLFKVPIMITYLKDTERNQNLLSTYIKDDLISDQNINEVTKPEKTIVYGESYTVEDLLKYMIEYSDNNATVLLYKHANQDTLKQVFSDLDIQLPKDGVTTDFISVQSYSLLFRILYNATYLTHDMSEKGLEMLSKIDFKEGIRKSIPSTIPVADKFGEYFLLSPSGTKSDFQLHDCGIVYHPSHPYLLCVMTRGSSFDDLKTVIQNISKVSYDIVSTF